MMGQIGGIFEMAEVWHVEVVMQNLTLMLHELKAREQL
jgi:hypothetical protein